MATKAEKEEALIEERTTALLDGRKGVVNPTGETLVFDPTVPGMWRKATDAESREHDNDLDPALVSARAEQAATPNGTDNP